MQSACDHLQLEFPDAQVSDGRSALLAAALLHDVGHGPFSHVFEPCLGIDHEEWSRRIILSPESKCHQILAKVNPYLPERVANLINPDSEKEPSWMKYLLSSQLDVDRLDYLRRDSFFSGAGYGHYDWFRILSTFRLHELPEDDRAIVWPQKAVMAVEEYVFARFYMYQNVYLHKTTRGFEKMLVAMWQHARESENRSGTLPDLADFWNASEPIIQQYLAIEEFTVLQQIQNWTGHPDPGLSDLARRFLSRNRLAMIEPPPPAKEFEFGAELLETWHLELRKVVQQAGFDPDLYCLREDVKPKYRQPYFPEKEGDDQSARNAIRILVDDNSPPIEISQLCPRLVPVTQAPVVQTRHYVPAELRQQILKLRSGFSK